MNTWHIDDTVASAYCERRLGAVERASVEAHAIRCEQCRAVLGALATTAISDLGTSELDLDRLWTQIETTVTTPVVGRGGQAMLRIGLPMSDVVVTRVVAAQSRQWTIATTLVLAVTAVAAVLGRVDSAHAAFLVVAPLLPALGVAATYRLVPHGIDLLERAAPFSPARMLLWRTAYVTVTAVPVAIAVGAVVLHHPGGAVSWLLPALACTLCVVSAATRHDPVRPAAFVALGWSTVVIAWQVRDTPWAITTAPTQLAAAIISVGASFLLYYRLTSDPTPPAFGGA